MVEVIVALKQEQEEGVVDIGSGGEDADKVVKRRRKKACDPQKQRACVDCTKRCARIHGRAASSSSLPSSSKARPVPAVPSFFKVMMGDFSENMDIPPPFAQTILDLSGSNIYLEDAFGLRWRVRLCFDDGVLSFGYGWKNFVLDHAIACGEFLVFRKIARSVFTVQMFAPSAVERLYLCERNKRQSRKRKPRQKTSSPSIQTYNISKNNVETCKKRQRTELRNDPDSRECNMSVHVSIDDSDVPNSSSELKCSETSEKAPEAGAAESQAVSEDLSRYKGKAHLVFDRDSETAEFCTIYQEKEYNATVIVPPVSNATEFEQGEGSNSPTTVHANGPLAMMDLNEVITDDIYLSADIYEFESDICNPEALSIELNTEGLGADGQTSGFDFLENSSQKHHSSMGAGERFVMSETIPCTENKQMTIPCTMNKQMTDVLGTCTGFATVPAHDMDINVLPPNDQTSFGKDNTSRPTDAELPCTECALDSCNKYKCSCKGNQAAQKEASGLVPADSSAMQDKSQDGQVNMQDSTEHHADGIMSSSSKPHELPHLTKDPLETGDKSGGLQTGGIESGGVLALAAGNKKFCIAVPAPGQTWLELPCRLPVLPRTKKQGRKVVILKDPCMRLWPVLYQCTPRFNGFITGWVDISRENSLGEGDTCEFELSGNSDLSFQVRIPNVQ